MIIPEKTVCDFCGNDADYKNVRIPVITDCSWEDGYPMKDYVMLEPFDVCKECLFKIANVKCGFRGTDPVIIRKCEKE